MSSLDMSAFKEVELEDRPVIEDFAFKHNRRSCELNFCNMFNWNLFYDYKWQIYKDRLVVILQKGDQILFPGGEYFSPEELAELTDSIRATGHRGRIYDVPEDYLNTFPELKDYFGIIKFRGAWDYVYLTENLYCLPGKKLRKKRNHISQFERNFSNWAVKPISSETAHDSKIFLTDSYENSAITNMLKEDYLAMNTALKHHPETGLEGLVLYAEEKFAAISLFSRQTPDTYTVHFEKADKNIKGASQVINRETAGFLLERCKYINREQDLGISGLRLAKRSYGPEFQIKVYSLDRKR